LAVAVRLFGGPRRSRCKTPAGNAAIAVKDAAESARDVAHLKAARAQCGSVDASGAGSVSHGIKVGPAAQIVACKVTAE